MAGNEAGQHHVHPERDAIRSRRGAHRTLTQVEDRVADAKKKETEEAQKADEAAAKSLEAARAELQKKVDKIRDDKSLDSRTRDTMLQNAQQFESTRFAIDELNIKNTQKQEVKKIKDQTAREIKEVENKIRMLAIALPPVPALMLGIFVFALRARDERMGIIPDRLVGKEKGKTSK
jgi:ABC-2 type transport system permease protein